MHNIHCYLFVRKFVKNIGIRFQFHDFLPPSWILVPYFGTRAAEGSTNSICNWGYWITRCLRKSGKKSCCFFKKRYRYLINSRDIWDFLGIFDWKMITLEEIPCAVPWYKVQTKHKTYYSYVIDFISNVIRYYLAFFFLLR